MKTKPTEQRKGEAIITQQTPLSDAARQASHINQLASLLAELAVRVLEKEQKQIKP